MVSLVDERTFTSFSFESLWAVADVIILKFRACTHVFTRVRWTFVDGCRGEKYSIRKTSQYKELYNNWINWFNFAIQRKRLFTGFSFFFRKKVLQVCTWRHGGHVDDKNKTISLLGELNSPSCKFYQNLLYDHQYSRLVTWLQTSNCQWFRTLLRLLQTPKQGLSQRIRGAGISPRLLGARPPGSFHGKKERKVGAIQFGSILRLVLAYTRQHRILATALPKGLLQSTQSKLAFKTVTENRRKAQH